MVTAEVIEGKPEGKQEYPCTMILKHSDLIVGFEKHGEGTVIAPGSTRYSIYTHIDNCNMENFTPFTGSVTLRNG